MKTAPGSEQLSAVDALPSPSEILEETDQSVSAGEKAAWPHPNQVGTDSREPVGKRPKSTEASAGFISKLSFNWVSGIVATGFSRPLEHDDIPLINPRRSTHGLAGTVQTAFISNKGHGYKYPLWWALHDTFKREFWIGGACRLVADIFLVTTPYTLRYLIQFVTDTYEARRRDESGPPVWHGIALLVGIIVMQAMQSVAHNHFMFMLGAVGGQVRAVLTSAVFDKSIRVLGRQETAKLVPAGGSVPKTGKAKSSRGEGPEKDRGGHAVGSITNLMSVDATRIDRAAAALHILWTAPVALILALSLLVVNLGVSALAGFGFLFLGFALLLLAVRKLFIQRRSIDKLTEDRVSRTQEILGAIRQVKFFGWEEGLAKRLMEVRGTETKHIQGYVAVRSAVVALSQSLPVLTSMISFVTYSLVKGELPAAIVFSSVALFSSLRMHLVYLPLCIQGSIDSWAALLRIQEYLLTKEPENSQPRLSVDAAVKIRGGEFEWNCGESGSPVPSLNESLDTAPVEDEKHRRSSFTLRNIDLRVRRGEFLAVIGPVASGKTSLVSALTGDMAMTSGTMEWGTSYVACPQKPWIQNGTVRENITFGHPFEEIWYNQVIEACSLTQDLEALPYGDGTIVGERGVVVSGGQKQRISLARAIYSRAPTVLLDDPLSAVDANIRKMILDKAICGLMATRTRILVTHQLNILGLCDRVLWMENGIVRAIDTYENLLANSPEFSRMMEGLQGVKNDGIVETAGHDPKAGKELDGAEMDKLIADEDCMGSHSVPWRVYGSLFAWRKGIFLFAICMPTLLLAQGSTILTSLWLSWWSSNRLDMARDVYIGIYTGLATSQLLFLYIFGLILGIWCTTNSHLMLSRAILRVFRAPIVFFDTTPLGRLTNRFSSDVEALDYFLTESLRMFASSLTGLAAIFALIIAYFYWFAVAVGVLVSLLIGLAYYYRASAREITRHESSFRSVVYSRFLEGLSGAATIRVYGVQSNFTRRLHDALDDMNSARFIVFANQRWLSLRQDGIGNLLLMIMGILVLVDAGKQHSAVSGLVLSLILQALQVIQVVVREWADVETAMNSAERLYSYANTVPQEGGDNIRPTHENPEGDWPQKGTITFSDVRMRYRPGLPEVLQGFNLSVRSGEHVAIVGRTGAGKSSLINSLFRVTELSGGSITIDGRDISQVWLGELRKALSIIPQDTTWFRGTVRSNLDPLGSHPDERLSNALKDVGMEDKIQLSNAVQDDGGNLSLGQMQLLALARVLVRDSRILVCDEATASLDNDTDNHIQRTMKSVFKERTMICIAHRLRTVLWYDRICVMDGGVIAELGAPLELFLRKGSMFRKMCLQDGITEDEIRKHTSFQEAESDT